MAERIKNLEKGVNDLGARKQRLLSTERTEENAEFIFSELMAIAKDEKSLENRIKKENARRDKIDKIGVPIVSFALLLSIVCAVITIFSWLISCSFPVILGAITLSFVSIFIVTVVVMKILNPDMKL